MPKPKKENFYDFIDLQSKVKILTTSTTAWKPVSVLNLVQRMVGILNRAGYGNTIRKMDYVTMNLKDHLLGFQKLSGRPS